MSWLKKISSIVRKYFKKDINIQNKAKCTIYKISYKRVNDTYIAFIKAS